MRSLTLAKHLIALGAYVRFVSRHMPEYLQQYILAAGCDFKLIAHSVSAQEFDDLQHSSWLGTSQEQDGNDTKKLLGDNIWDCLIVDHYGLDKRWESSLRDITKKIFVIDDIADRIHDCDLLLDQNLYIDMTGRYDAKVPAHCERLLGPDYAILRQEFIDAKKHARTRSAPVRNILVFFGGVDAVNCTSKAIEGLLSIDLAAIQINIVIGSAHPKIAEIEHTCYQHGMVCHIQTDRMAELVLHADLAIGAAGSASWERCCLGLPTLMISVADNQIGIAETLHHYAASQYLGRFDDVSASDIAVAIVELSSNVMKLNNISKNSFALVSGNGVHKICEKLGF